MTKLVEFMYTKANGAQSQRAVIEVQTPNKFVEGIDVTQLSEHDFAQFCAEYGELKRKQYLETMQVIEKFDLKQNYRRFDPSKMTNIAVDYV